MSVASIGCSSPTTTLDSTGTEPAPTATCAPPAPAGPAPDGTTDLVLAIRSIDFGDATPDGWKSLGCNFDGLVSDATSTDVCQPLWGGLLASVKTDGVEGRDNSFGENLMPLLVGLAGDVSKLANDESERGGATALLVLDGIGSRPDYFPVTARAYAAAPVTTPPTWDGSDVRSVAFESVSDGSIDAPLLAWNASYVVGREWASAQASSAPLSFPISLFGEATAGSTSAASLWLPIRYARVSVRLATDGTNAVNGRISGVLDAEELQRKFLEATWAMPQKMWQCEGDGLQSVREQIRAMSDMLKDGTQDPTKTCDGISIGLEFTAVPVKLGGVAPPDPPPSDPCAGPVGTADGG